MCVTLATDAPALRHHHATDHDAEPGALDQVLVPRLLRGVHLFPLPFDFHEQRLAALHKEQVG